MDSLEQGGVSQGGAAEGQVQTQGVNHQGAAQATEGQSETPQGFVPLSDFQALQSSLNQQNDTLRNELKQYQSQLVTLQAQSQSLPDQLQQVTELAMQNVPEERRGEIRMIQLEQELESQRRHNHQLQEYVQRQQVLGDLQRTTGADLSSLEPNASFMDATNVAIQHLLGELQSTRDQLSQATAQTQANLNSVQESSASATVGQQGTSPTIQSELQSKYTQAMIAGNVLEADRVHLEALNQGVSIDNMAWVSEKYRGQNVREI